MAKPDMNQARKAHAALKQKQQHGGAREGAGRKEVYSADQKPVRITVEVSSAQAAKFKRWSSAKGLKSHADAIRSFIDGLPD